MRDHLSALFSLSARHNPSNQIEWFVLSPFLRGKESAVTSVKESKRTAFAHRDLKTIWEMHAVQLDGGSRDSDVDLVELVKGMMFGLGTVDAVCKCAGAFLFPHTFCLLSIDT
jgi:hypothetical protein